MLPILTIRLELTGSQVLFNPSLDENSASSSVQESVEGWLNDLLGRGDAVRPVDEDLKVKQLNFWIEERSSQLVRNLSSCEKKA